jgi:hypothetical protein
VRSIEGSDLDALDFHPEFKIESGKGLEDQFEQLILALNPTQYSLPINLQYNRNLVDQGIEPSRTKGSELEP